MSDYSRYCPPFEEVPYAHHPEWRRQLHAIYRAAIDRGDDYPVIAAAVTQLRAEWDAKFPTPPGAECAP